MLKIIVTGLSIGGALMLLLALLSGGGALMASFERIQHSQGHVSSNAGFFGLLALIGSVLGAFSLIIARRIARLMRRGKE
jgi:hypothetical protein